MPVSVERCIIKKHGIILKHKNTVIEREFKLMNIAL
jgi:hypothetical protein